MVLIDPIEGWKYGFPMLAPKDVDYKKFMIDNGYPKSLMDEYGKYFRYTIQEITTYSISEELQLILDTCKNLNINSVTFPANSFEVEHILSSDDKDYVVFWRNEENKIVDVLFVNSNETTSSPVWDDWYMTITYHA